MNNLLSPCKVARALPQSPSAAHETADKASNGVDERMVAVSSATDPRQSPPTFSYAPHSHANRR